MKKSEIKQQKKSKSVVRDSKDKIAKKLGLGPKVLDFSFKDGGQTFPN